MYLHAISNVTPPHALSQQDCWNILQHSDALAGLKERSVSLLEKILCGESGIAKRHFAVPELQLLPARNAEFLNREFLREAPALSSRALHQALEKAQLRAQDIDALFVCTCTGYLCPGISSYVAEKLNFKCDAYLQDLVGLGCGAAVPTLRSAHHFIAANPQAKVACIAVEICSAAFYLDDDPGVIISLCLFGDGASASIWSDSSNHRLYKPDKPYKISHFNTLHIPSDRELLRFENKDGKLRNKLHRSVPEKASVAVKELYEARRATNDDIDTIVSHGGGRDVIDALCSAIPTHDFSSAKTILNQYGNMSSPSVLFALEEALVQNKPQRIWLTSFGAGFAAHSCSLSV